jgi:hypothetical protein
MKLALAALLFAPAAFGQVTLVDTDSNSGTGTSLTVPAVDSGGANGYIVCDFMFQQTGGQTLTSVTIGGSAATSLATPTDTGSGRNTYRYGRATSSSGNCVITPSASAFIQGVTRSFSGVDVGGTPAGTSQSSIPSSSPTTTSSVTSAVGGLVVDSFYAQGITVTSIAEGASQTQQSVGPTSGCFDDGTGVFFCVSTKAGASSVTMSWTWTNGFASGHIVTPLNAAASASAAPPASQYYRRRRG